MFTGSLLQSGILDFLRGNKDVKALSKTLEKLSKRLEKMEDNQKDDSKIIQQIWIAANKLLTRTRGLKPKRFEMITSNDSNLASNLIADVLHAKFTLQQSRNGFRFRSRDGAFYGVMAKRGPDVLVNFVCNGKREKRILRGTDEVKNFVRSMVKFGRPPRGGFVLPPDKGYWQGYEPGPGYGKPFTRLLKEVLVKRRDHVPGGELPPQKRAPLKGPGPMEMATGQYTTRRRRMRYRGGTNDSIAAACDLFAQAARKDGKIDEGEAWGAFKQGWTKFKIAKSKKDEKGMKEAAEIIKKFGDILVKKGEIEKSNVPEIRAKLFTSAAHRMTAAPKKIPVKEMKAPRGKYAMAVAGVGYYLFVPEGMPLPKVPGWEAKPSLSRIMKKNIRFGVIWVTYERSVAQKTAKQLKIKINNPSGQWPDGGKLES